MVSLPDVALFNHLKPENKARRLQAFYEGMLRSYVNDNFVKEGMVADIALHAPSDKNDDRHFHAHIMLSTRKIGADGFGKKERGWNEPRKLEGWREGFAKMVNDTLSAHGIKGFVDHRTYAERGLDIGATQSLGHHAHQMERFGRPMPAGNDNQRIQRDNMVQHKYLEKVFEHSPIAPLYELESAISRAGFDDPETVLDQLMGEGKLKALRSAETGHKSTMFSFTPMVERLERIRAKSEDIYNRKDFVLPQKVVDDAVQPRGDKKVREALRYVAGCEGFKVVESENTGHKTTFLSSLRHMYADAGYDLVAVARNNDGKAAFKAAGFSKGVLTYRDLLRRFGDRYTGAKSQTQKVIIVDEADGLSPLQDQEIFTCAQKINAKLIYLGNQRQKKKKLWQSLYSYYKRLTTFRRLREKFFKSAKETEAIREAFMQARTMEALKRQRRAKRLCIKDTAFEAKRAVLDHWFKTMKKRDDKRFILVATDADAQIFNFEVQKQRLKKKHLKHKSAKMFTVSYQSDKGKKLKRDLSLHSGDMIQFKTTYHDLDIEEGTRARVLHHRHDHSLIEIDDGRLMKVDLLKHNGFDLGYAGRSVSSSGKLAQGYLYHSKANALDEAPLLYQYSSSPVRLYTDVQTAPDLTALSAQLLGRGHTLYEGYAEDTDNNILTPSTDNAREGDGHDTTGLT